MRFISTVMGKTILAAIGGICILSIFDMFFFHDSIFTKLIIETLNSSV